MSRGAIFAERLTWLGKALAALADHGLVASSGFLLMVLLGRWLPPEQYGAYAVAFSVFLFLGGVYQALMLEPMSVFGPGAVRDHLPEYLGELFRLQFGLSALLSLLMGGVIAVFGRALHDASLISALWGASLGLPCIFFFWLWRRASYLEPKPRVSLCAAAAYAGTLLALLALFRWMGWLSAFTPFLIQMIAASVAGGLLLARTRPKLRALRTGPQFRAILKRHWEYGRWAVATAIVYWISSGAYYVLVGAMLRMEDVAGLRALQNISVPLPQFVTAMSLFLLPHVSAKFAKEGATSFRQSTQRMIFVLAGCGVVYMLGVLVLGPSLFRHLYGDRYAESARLIPLLAAPIPLMAASESLAMALRAMQAPVEVFRGYLAAGIVTLCAGLPLVWLHGLGGALLCIVLSYLVFTLVLAHRYRVRLRHLATSRVATELAAALPERRVVGLPIFEAAVRKQEFHP